MSNPALLNVTELMVLDALRSHVKRFGSQQEFASSHGVSPSYVCDVLAGRRSVPEAWVSVLGYRKIGWVLDSATAICCEHGAPWQGRDCWKCNDLAAECKKASIDLLLDGECFMREGKRIDPAVVPTEENRHPHAQLDSYGHGVDEAGYLVHSECDECRNFALTKYLKMD